MPNHPQTETLIRSYVDAIASRKLDDVFAYYADDIAYPAREAQPLTFGSSLTGRRAALRVRDEQSRSPCAPANHGSVEHIEVQDHGGGEMTSTSPHKRSEVGR